MASAALALDWLFGPRGIAASLVTDHGDAIYSRLVLRMVNSARPTALAIATPLRDVAWAGIIFPAGSSSVGIQVLELAVNLAMVAAAAALLVVSGTRWRRQLIRRVRSWPVVAVAALSLAYGAGAQLRLSWSGSSGGEIALSMVATKLLGIDSSVYGAALHQGWLLSLAVNVLLIASAAGIGAGILLLLLRVGVGRRFRWRWRPRARVSPARLPLLAGVAGLALLVAPMQNRVVFEPASGVVSAGDLAPLTFDVAVDELTEAAAAVPSAAEALPSAVVVADTLPSVVTITTGGRGFEYVVNGRQAFIRGMGFNAQTGGASAEQRAGRYDRDFAAIHAMSANTVTGWDQAQFDEVLLAKAAEHRLGVILPFELQASWAYDDGRVRQQLLEGITHWVERYKDSPAVRMWGLGNEVIHSLVPARGRRPQAFAEFLVQAADVVHRLDPNHPVIYRDAEDVYLAPLAAALRADGRARPWFVYGMNFFTTRLGDALTKGPALALHQPVLVSEFGPVGLRPADRPAAYEKLWKIVATHRGSVLGGCAYVWTTAGPEPLDRGFGLTNEAGEPVDGTLAALASLFAADQRDGAGRQI